MAITALTANQATVFTGSGDIFGYSGGGNIFTSTDNGLRWIRADSNLFFVTDLASAQGGVLTWTLGVGMLVSRDDGGSWSMTSAPNGLISSPYVSFAAAGSNVFVGYDKGVFLTKNLRGNWDPINSGLLDAEVNELYVSNGELYAATTNGVWKWPLSDTVDAVTLPPAEVPLGYELSQNYPNPFNPTTIILYYLPKGGPVTLTIYDILGRKVKTLVDQTEQAGEYSVIFDAPSLASGVYFYRLSSGSFNETKKMVLIR